MTSTSEALVAANIRPSTFNGHMPPIATGPVPAEMAEMPGFVYISFHLLLCKLTFDNQSDDADIDGKSVFARGIIPDEIVCDGTHRAPVSASWGWKWMKPAVDIAAHMIKELVDITNVPLHPFFHVIIWSVHEMSLAV